MTDVKMTLSVKHNYVLTLSVKHNYVKLKMKIKFVRLATILWFY